MHPPYMHFRRVSRGVYGVAFRADSGSLKEPDKRDKPDKPDRAQGGYPGLSEVFV